MYQKIDMDLAQSTFILFTHPYLLSSARWMSKKRCGLAHQPLACPLAARVQVLNPFSYGGPTRLDLF